MAGEVIKFLGAMIFGRWIEGIFWILMPTPIITGSVGSNTGPLTIFMIALQFRSGRIRLLFQGRSDYSFATR